MAPITASVEVARSPEDVFAYVSDVSRHPEWQEGLVSASAEPDGPVGMGTRVVHRRKLGPFTVATASEISAFDPPSTLGFRGLDGPVRTEGSQRVEPSGEGSRVSFEMEMSGHGIGKLMLPLARKQAQRGVVESHEKLKRILEGSAD